MRKHRERESIPKFEPTTVPYETGDHCVFYAIQAANTHFNKKGLSLEDRTRLKEKAQQTVDLYKKNTGIERGIGASEKVTLMVVIPELERLNIVPERFVCGVSTRDAIEGVEVVQKIRVPFEIKGEGQKFSVERPSLLFTETREAPHKTHVWFCSDGKSFAKERELHIPNGNKLVLAVPLAKKMTK